MTADLRELTRRFARPGRIDAILLRPARMPHQRAQHGEVAAGQWHFLAVAPEGSGCQIDAERAEAQDRLVDRGLPHRRCRRPTAQHGLHAGHQFARVEGLADVIVGAGLQAQHDQVDGVEQQDAAERGAALRQADIETFLGRVTLLVPRPPSTSPIHK